MRLNELSPGDGAKKAAKRVGRGIGSGFGKTACKELGLVATDIMRLPMTPITDHGRDVVAFALKHAGLL